MVTKEHQIEILLNTLLLENIKEEQRLNALNQLLEWSEKPEYFALRDLLKAKARELDTLWPKDRPSPPIKPKPLIQGKKTNANKIYAHKIMTIEEAFNLANSANSVKMEDLKPKK